MNELEHSISISDDLPWREIPEKGGHWEDSDDAQLRLYLERTQGFTAREKIYDAILIESSNHTFHPIRDYLKGCEWDGTPRVDTLLVDCLGAEDTAYTRAVTRKTLTAAAMTYVAATAVSLAQLLRLILIFGGRRRRD